MGSNRSKTNAPRYVAHYGMVRDPFGQKVEDDLFYPEPSRKQRLGTLLHLTQFGNELMILTGPKGSGKTTLLQQFKSTSPKTWKIANIEAQGGLDERKLLQQLYRQMGMKFQGATHGEVLKQMIIQFDLLQRKGRYCVMLIDNADQLPVTAIKKIMEMATLTSTVNKSLIRIILFGTGDLAKNLNDPLLGKHSSLPQRFMELSPFSEEQTAHYVLKRLSAAHFTNNELFTPSVLVKLHTESYGWPARINELAREILTEALPKNERELLPGFDIKAFHASRLFGLALTIGLVAVFFVFQDNVYSWTNQFTATAKTLPKPETKIAKPSVPKIKPATTLVEKLKQRSQTYRPESSTAKLANPGLPKPELSKPELSKPELSKPGLSKPGLSKLKSALPSEFSAVDIATLPRKESWILNQNSNHYTLQVVAGENLKTIEAFIGKHNLRNNIAFYRSVRKGKPWYGLIYGVYTHKQAASSAIKGLSKKLQKLKPWVRKINSIKKDIYKTRP